MFVNQVIVMVIEVMVRNFIEINTRLILSPVFFCIFIENWKVLSLNFDWFYVKRNIKFPRLRGTTEAGGGGGGDIMTRTKL